MGCRSRPLWATFVRESKRFFGLHEARAPQTGVFDMGFSGKRTLVQVLSAANSARSKSCPARGCTPLSMFGPRLELKAHILQAPLCVKPIPGVESTERRQTGGGNDTNCKYDPTGGGSLLLYWTVGPRAIA